MFALLRWNADKNRPMKNRKRRHISLFSSGCQIWEEEKEDPPVYWWSLKKLKEYLGEKFDTIFSRMSNNVSCPKQVKDDAWNCRIIWNAQCGGRNSNDWVCGQRIFGQLTSETELRSALHFEVTDGAEHHSSHCSCLLTHTWIGVSANFVIKRRDVEIDVCSLFWGNGTCQRTPKIHWKRNNRYSFTKSTKSKSGKPMGSLIKIKSYLRGDSLWDRGGKVQWKQCNLAVNVCARPLRTKPKPLKGENDCLKINIL